MEEEHLLLFAEFEDIRREEKPPEGVPDERSWSSSPNETVTIPAGIYRAKNWDFNGNDLEDLQTLISCTGENTLQGAIQALWRGLRLILPTLKEERLARRQKDLRSTQQEVKKSVRVVHLIPDVFANCLPCSFLPSLVCISERESAREG